MCMVAVPFSEKIKNPYLSPHPILGILGLLKGVGPVYRVPTCVCMSVLLWTEV